MEKKRESLLMGSGERERGKGERARGAHLPPPHLSLSIRPPPQKKGEKGEAEGKKTRKKKRASHLLKERG
jgi:hypothetical protein